jgi:hypothetical protein
MSRVTSPAKTPRSPVLSGQPLRRAHGSGRRIIQHQNAVDPDRLRDRSGNGQATPASRRRMFARSTAGCRAMIARCKRGPARDRLASQDSGWSRTPSPFCQIIDQVPEGPARLDPRPRWARQEQIRARAGPHSLGQALFQPPDKAYRSPLPATSPDLQRPVLAALPLFHRQAVHPA